MSHAHVSVRASSRSHALRPGALLAGPATPPQDLQARPQSRPRSTAPSPGVHPRLALLLARSLAPRPLARLLVLVPVRLLARRPAVADLRRSTPAVISVGAGDHAGRPGRGQASVRTFRHSHRLRPSCMPHMAHARTRRDAAPGLAVFSPAASLVATADAISSPPRSRRARPRTRRRWALSHRPTMPRAAVGRR